MTRVLIADDHPIVLSGIESVLRDSRYQIVAKVADGAAVLEILAAARPDILILDVHMPQRSGMDVVRILRSRGDQRRVVLLTARLSDEDLIEALQIGVRGIILKDGANGLLLRCLEEVERGGRWIDKALLERALSFTLNGLGPKDQLSSLSVRERSVVGLVAKGLRNRQMAAELGLTEGTVKVYLHQIYVKLEVGSRTELAILANNTEKTAGILQPHLA